MADRVRIALVGLGGHGRTIQRAVAEAGSFNVVSVFDVLKDEAENAARRFGVPAAESFDALLADDRIDAVALVTPNHLHLDQALAAFKAGKHVFVEKPIANRLRDGETMIQAAEDAGRTLMVGHNMRFAPSVRKARAMLASDAIGEVATVEFHFSTDTAHHMKPGAWRLNPDQCPLMPMMQLGIHAVDLVHHLLGMIDMVGARSRSVHAAPPVQDVVTGMMRLESGVTGTFVSTYCTRITFSITVSGTEGSLVITPHTLRHFPRVGTDGHGDGPSEFHDFRDRDFESYRLQMEEFAAAFLEKRPPDPDAASGLQALAVVSAMEESVSRGAFVDVPRFDKQPART